MSPPQTLLTGLLGGLLDDCILTAVRMRGPKIAATRKTLTTTVKSPADTIGQGLMRDIGRDTIERIAGHLEIDKSRKLEHKIKIPQKSKPKIWVQT